MHLLVSLLIFILILFIFVIAAIKINNPFWNLMPVYHKYDVWRYLYKECFIFRQPIKNKYYDLLQINTLEYNELSEENIDEIIRLLQCHYLGDDNLLYVYDKKKLNDDITGCENESLISIYNKQKYNLINGEIKVINTTEIKSCIISKKINLFIDGNKYKSYLLNNICCNRDETNDSIRRKILFTHIFNSINKKPIECFIIKKEYNLFKNVVPIVVYKSLDYKINLINKSEMSNLMNIKKIEANQIDVIGNLISNINAPNKYFNVCFYPDIGNIKSQILNKHIEIYVLYYKQNALAYYIIKDNFIHNEKEDSESITLISSINNCPNNKMFFNGFYYILSDIIKKFPQRNRLSIEDNSHNRNIIELFNQYYKPYSTHDIAYYSINLFVPGTPRESNSIFSFF
jgi:hypothetical protein